MGNLVVPLYLLVFLLKSYFAYLPSLYKMVYRDTDSTTAIG